MLPEKEEVSFLGWCGVLLRSAIGEGSGEEASRLDIGGMA
jgi:hypothetical protein